MMMMKSIEINGEWTLSFRDEQQKLDSEADAEKMAKIIENAELVEVLELRGNTVGVGAGQRLARALEFHPELKRALWSDMFTGRLKEEIPSILCTLCDAMIRSGTRLIELDLSDNAFGPIGAEGLKEFLESSSAYSLKVLKLNNNGLGAGGKIIAKALIQCHANARKDGQNFQLKTFIAGRNRLEDPGAFALAEAFQVLGSLEEITMYQDGIRPKGIEALSKSFRYNSNLKIINLSDNTFTVNGAHAMAQVVRDLKNLEVLNFGDCLCRDKGALDIIANISLSFHSRLKEINLSGNELSPHAIKTILNKVNEGLHLKSLILHTNNMGNQFDKVKSECEKYDFIDLGEESDDQGTLDEESDDNQELYSEKSNSSDSNSESDVERVKNDSATHVITFDRSLEPDNYQTTISFRNQQWNSEEDVGAIIDALFSQKFAKILDLRENHIGIIACRKIAEVLRERMRRNMQSLEEVNLSQNDIAAEGMLELVHAFRSNPKLKIIILSGNSLKVDGAVAVAQVLPSLPLLEVLDLSSCACLERGILAVVANLNSSIHLRLKILDFSSNALGANAVQQIIRLFASGGFHLERLSLHSNNIGRRFNELKEEFSYIHFLDLGTDSNNPSSLMEDISVIDGLKRESWNRSDDEYVEDLNNLRDDIILFIKKPSVAMLDTLLSHVKTLVETLHADLCGRTQEITAALLCSFCILLSMENVNKPVLKEKITTLTDAILTAAKIVKRRPVCATESICNQLLAFAGAVRVCYFLYI
ncbi:unnamed protein product [Onchocerca flexuosa]|uniref:Ran GTPase-activating protein 1 n=1 Tax=Onchocerca flexuosa TaxID=387005 RepID=A0A183H1R3_9BILA|nr:unnamed protein product [Onchocerca flexuosa]